MKLVKSLLLGSATALVAVSGASAADLGVKKPSPVEYVKVCNTYGAGFFYIPGGNTCLKIGGRARAEYYFGENRHAGYNAGSDTGFRAQGHIQLDARTATEYGTLRTFVRLILNSRTGNAVSGTQQRYGDSTVATGADFNGQTQTNLDFVAFIQFAGFTAGRAGSFFDFYTGDLNWQGAASNGQANGIAGATNLFAYTATFGQGFSATISIEDPIRTRQYIATGRDQTLAAGNIALTGRAPLGAVASAGNQSFYGGEQLPDFVGNVRYEAAWGAAQIAGAVHEVIPTRITGGGAGAAAQAVARDYGWAVQGGVKVNLPFIGAGDTLWLQAGYGEGTNGFINAGGYKGSGNLNGSFDGYVAETTADALAYIGADGRARIELSQTFAGFAGFEHYWTPTIRQSIFGAYSEVNYGRGVAPQLAGSAGVLAIAGTSISQSYEWQVGSRIIWSPIKDLDIGAEVQYQSVGNNNRASNYVGGVLPVNVRLDSDQIIARFRVQRDF